MRYQTHNELVIEKNNQLRNAGSIKDLNIDDAIQKITNKLLGRGFGSENKVKIVDIINASIQLLIFERLKKYRDNQAPALQERIGSLEVFAFGNNHTFDSDIHDFTQGSTLANDGREASNMKLISEKKLESFKGVGISANPSKISEMVKKIVEVLDEKVDQGYELISEVGQTGPIGAMKKSWESLGYRPAIRFSGVGLLMQCDAVNASRSSTSTTYGLGTKINVSRDLIDTIEKCIEQCRKHDTNQNKCIGDFLSVRDERSLSAVSTGRFEDMVLSRQTDNSEIAR